MFLNQLTSAEKEAFISLSVHAAKANGIIEETEYKMLEEYCKEMGVAFFDIKNSIDIGRIIGVFKDAEEKHKKIVLLEIIGMLHADGKVDEQERSFAIDFAKKIGLEEGTVKTYFDLIARYLGLVNEIYQSF